MGKPYAKEGPSAEDKALDLFADMMIERIQSLSGKDGWKKPWFTEGALQWPKNLNGREYNGMNAMMLLLHCEKEGYKIPRFCTFDRIQQFNKTGKKDEEQKPRVSVLKGEHSFPVMLTTFTVVNKETKGTHQVGGLQTALSGRARKVQCISKASDLPCLQCGADQPEGGQTRVLGETGTGILDAQGREGRAVCL